MKLRKTLVIVLSAVMMLGLIAVPASARPRNDALKEILETIQSDYEATMTKIKQEDDKLYDALGEDYNSYIKSSSMVQEYFDTVFNECNNLYAKLDEQGVTYYKAVVKELDMDESRDWSHAMNDLYKLVYEKIYDNIYDEVYSGYLEDTYDEVYSYILYDKPDSVSYDDYSVAKNEFYNTYSMGREDFYDNWNDNRELFYNRLSDVADAFSIGATEVDDILNGKVNEDLEAILATIEKDFTDTAKKISDEADKAGAALGTTLESFEKNYSGIQALYELIDSESEELYERTEENAIEYFKTIVETCNMKDVKDWRHALNVIKSRIYRDAFGGYQKSVYRSKFKELYSKYYSGLFNTISQTVKYDDYKEARQTFYDDWYEARSAFYDNWNEERGDFYDATYDVFSAFSGGDTDIDAIFADD